LISAAVLAGAARAEPGLSTRWLLAFALTSGCGADAVITLGQGPVPAFSDAGRRVAAINSEQDDSGATLTEDLLEIYFTSQRAGGPGQGDVWRATRASRTEPFGAATLLEPANSADRETSPAIEPDGLTLWLGSDRGQPGGDLDIWRMRRSSREADDWGPLENIVELNSDADDLPRPPTLGGLVMPIASRRGGQATLQTYLASRPAEDAAFDNVRPLTELWQDGISMLDAFLSSDGLLLFYAREEAAGEGDIFMASRRSPEREFRDVVPLSDLNTADAERDPWLSADGKRFFFSSNRRRATALDIYATSVELPRFE
jgi:WD40 repeat protein